MPSSTSCKAESTETWRQKLGMSGMSHSCHLPIKATSNSKTVWQNPLKKKNICSMSGISTYIYHKCMVNVPHMEHVGMINEALGSH